MSAITRFRPTRAGIVGLWDYTDATFAFADGRLVLRGANGSGKTKALEVLFPFVLDGRLDPRRLDPFSGENRTMKENLLWRGGDTGHGYAWMEFVRRGPSGERYVTVGVGLQGQRHRPTPRSWFFVVDGRVGNEIVLVDPDGRPRTKRALTEALSEGAIVERASEHRQRVDAALFGLGSERYEAMLDLVLTLRRPMLAKDLDPRLLSETLTRGLRPLDDDLVEQVARSFDDLEAVQRDLDRLIAADESARTFLTDYRGYLRTQARHRADLVIEALATRTAAEERRTAAERALDAARAAEAMAEAEELDVTEQLAGNRARRDALRASEAFTTAGQLEHLMRSVRDLAAEAERAERRAASATAAAAAALADRDRSEQALARADAEVARVAPRVAASALEAGVPWSDDDAHGSIREVGQRIGGRASARTADLAAVRQVLTALDDAERRVVAADEAATAAEAADERAAGDLDTAQLAVDEARTRLADDLLGWAAAHAEVVEPDDRDAVAAAVAEVGEADGPTPAEVWRDRQEPRRAAANGERARHGSALATLTEQTDALEARRQAILDERDDAPPILPWRGADRGDRPGAPLWRLVRFADDLPATAAAGIEAALEAAGLLDAWVSPDGRVAGDAIDAYLITDEEDVGSGPRDAAPSRPSPSRSPSRSPSTLADVLVPEDQHDVPTSVVTSLLRKVQVAVADGDGDARTLAPSGAMVAPDGGYRLGPLAGVHRVDAPRYIGATARAAHRTARVAALDAEITALHAETRRFAAAIAEIDDWFVAVEAATAAVPATGPLITRLRDRDRAAGRRHQAREALAAARAAAEAARREVNDRRSAVQREARARSLPPSVEGVAEVAAALERFTADGAELTRALELAAVRRETADAASQRATDAAEAATASHADAAERRRQHDARQVELTTLQDRMGAAAAAVVADLSEVEAAITRGEADHRRLTEAVKQAAVARGQAEGEVTAASEAVAAAARQLEAADDRLAVLARPDLAGPLGLDVPTEATGTDLLDAVDELVTGVSGSDERRKAARTRITSGLEDLDRALGAGYHPSWDVEDDVVVVTIADDVGVRSVASFADELANQRIEQEALLTARERALFEDALLSSVCGQIHSRTQATRELVVTMDAEMRARRLSSGQTVGVAWRADDTATAEWKQVHRLLDQDPAHFGPDQLESLRRHFAGEIKVARAADPQAPYRELLAHVLDYRRWRRFELSLVEADGTSAPLTKARHARLSGGEKAASLHLPLFAAAHAAFAAARPGCPRLLGLDEAFAGIDDRGRSELLSLTVAFDLDLFMTGFDLWAVDRSVPAVAHYDLLHLSDEHAVSTLLVLWNGEELLEGRDAELALAGAVERHRPGGTDPASPSQGLFGTGSSDGPPSTRDR